MVGLEVWLDPPSHAPRHLPGHMPGYLPRHLPGQKPGHVPRLKSRMRMEIVLNNEMGMSFNWPMRCNGADVIRKCVSIRVGV